MRGTRGSSIRAAAAAIALAAALTAPAARPKGAADPPAGGTPAGVTAAPGAAKEVSGPSVRIAPRAHKMSTYSLTGRYEMHTQDVTFEAPPAYRDSFAYWTGRLKNRSKFEVYEISTRTLETGGDGSVPFVRQVPRFNVEVGEEGKTKVPYDPLEQILKTWIWEGSLDPLGNVRDLRKTAGRENDQLKNIAMPFLLTLFPALKGPFDLKVGESFVEARSLPVPEKLTISGLEELKMKMTRTYRLGKVHGRQAIFDVSIAYVTDPDQEIAAPDTSCVISGGGSGQTTFDLEDGVFVGASQPTSMSLEISAPLRPLPERPETANPGNAVTRIVMDINLSGKQTVTRPWGGDQD